ncbi:hypothetical protein J6590_070487 [Homalodisca vitripennis]|nr:hypothetical protein J6590_070487 [Homalodisca vitripennis]
MCPGGRVKEVGVGKFKAQIKSSVSTNARYQYEKIERDYAAAEPQIDNIIQSLIISVGSDTDSSDSEPEEEDNLSGIEELQ